LNCDKFSRWGRVHRNFKFDETQEMRLDGEIRWKYFDHFLFPIKELFDWKKTSIQ